jgi:uncharacterized surface protein with fasciclin (FAS1) repeats
MALAALAMPLASTQPANAQGGDIVDVAVANGFSTLVAAVQAAGLESTLRSPGPFTVFAPTNAAFSALGSATLNELLSPAGIPRLREILLYHVVPGSLNAAAVTSSTSLPTALGQNIRVNGTVLNGSVNIVVVDVPASNGIIHVIDAVLIPAASTTAARPGPGLPSGFELRFISCDVAVFDTPGGTPVGSNRILAGQTWYVNPTTKDDAAGRSWTEIFVSGTTNGWIPTDCVQ